MMIPGGTMVETVSFEAPKEKPEKPQPNQKSNADGKKKKKKSKAEKEERKKNNLEWKNYTRKAWSGKEANPHFSAYYMAQLPEDLSDWPAFTASLSKGLPVTLRLNSARCPWLAAALRVRCEEEFPEPGLFITFL